MVIMEKRPLEPTIKKGPNTRGLGSQCTLDSPSWNVARSRNEVSRRDGSPSMSSAGDESSVLTPRGLAWTPGLVQVLLSLPCGLAIMSPQEGLVKSCAGDDTTHRGRPSVRWDALVSKHFGRQNQIVHVATRHRMRGRELLPFSNYYYYYYYIDENK